MHWIRRETSFRAHSPYFIFVCVDERGTSERAARVTLLYSSEEVSTKNSLNCLIGVTVKGLVCKRNPIKSVRLAWRRGSWAGTCEKVLIFSREEKNFEQTQSNQHISNTRLIKTLQLKYQKVRLETRTREKVLILIMSLISPRFSRKLREHAVRLLTLSFCLCSEEAVTSSITLLCCIIRIKATLLLRYRIWRLIFSVLHCEMSKKKQTQEK